MREEGQIIEISAENLRMEIDKRATLLENSLDIVVYSDSVVRGYYDFLLSHGYHDDDLGRGDPDDDKNVRNYLAFHILSGSQLNEGALPLKFLDFDKENSAIAFLDAKIEELELVS